MKDMVSQKEMLMMSATAISAAIIILFVVVVISTLVEALGVSTENALGLYVFLSIPGGLIGFEMLKLAIKAGVEIIF